MLVKYVNESDICDGFFLLRFVCVCFSNRISFQQFFSLSRESLKIWSCETELINISKQLGEGKYISKAFFSESAVDAFFLLAFICLCNRLKELIFQYSFSPSQVAFYNTYRFCALSGLSMCINSHPLLLLFKKDKGGRRDEKRTNLLNPVNTFL